MIGEGGNNTQGVKRISKYEKRAVRTNMKRRESLGKTGRRTEQKRDEREEKDELNG